MYINPKSTICGFPALEARELVRFLHSNSPFDLSMLEKYLNINEKEAKNVLNKLLESGFVIDVEKEKINIFLPEDLQSNSIVLYKLTDNGGSLARSSAKQYKRKTVDKAFNAFMGRVKEINTSIDHLYRVSKVVIFGSYLGTNENLSDLDIALKVVPKMEGDEYRTKTREMVRREAGNKRLNIDEKAHYGYFKAMRYLKYRSSIISLHKLNGDDKELIEQSIHKVVLDEEF